MLAFVKLGDRLQCPCCLDQILKPFLHKLAPLISFIYVLQRCLV